MCPMAGSEYLKAHCVTCVFAGPFLSVFDQCRSDAFAAVFSVGDEHAELSDSIPHEVDVYRPNERDLSQDQRLSAKKALDLGGIGPSARSLPHARFDVVIDVVDQVRESLYFFSPEIRLNREPSRHFLCLLHATTFSFSSAHPASGRLRKRTTSKLTCRRFCDEIVAKPRVLRFVEEEPLVEILQSPRRDPYPDQRLPIAALPYPNPAVCPSLFGSRNGARPAGPCAPGEDPAGRSVRADLPK